MLLYSIYLEIFVTLKILLHLVDGEELKFPNILKMLDTFLNTADNGKSGGINHTFQM